MTRLYYNNTRIAYNAYSLILLDLVVLCGGSIILLFYGLSFLYKIVKSEQKYSKFEWEIDPCELYIQDNNSNEDGLEQHYTQTAYFRGNMVAIKPIHEKVEIHKEDLAIIKKIMCLNHPNIIEVVGFCVLFEQVMMITPYQGRGSLEDMLTDADFNLDNLLKISLMENLLHALIYVERSNFGFHGKLKPSNCLIDNNWVLRLSGVGLCSFAVRLLGEETNEFNENFIAPEIAKFNPNERNKHYNSLSDVYSFGKILRLVFQLDNSIPVLRDLYKGDTFYISQKELNNYVTYDERHFLNDLEDVSFICLRSDPTERLHFDEIEQLYKNIVQKFGCQSGESILDRALSRMMYTAENTQTILKNSVDQLKNYAEKYNTLLDETFPKSVSKIVRSGQKYETKYLEMVTLMFMDIPDFNLHCNTKTPFEIVSYLNDIHKKIDRIIENHKVYKLETIGSAYVVISGLTEAIDDSNPENIDITIQVERILELAIEINKQFLSENLEGTVRIGIHSGPVTAGIIGRLSPRFCLFGDTMNTTSRMKSSANESTFVWPYSPY